MHLSIHDYPNTDRPSKRIRLSRKSEELPSGSPSSRRPSPSGSSSFRAFDAFNSLPSPERPRAFDLFNSLPSPERPQRTRAFDAFNSLSSPQPPSHQPPRRALPSRAIDFFNALPSSPPTPLSQSSLRPPPESEPSASPSPLSDDISPLSRAFEHFNSLPSAPITPIRSVTTRTPSVDILSDLPSSWLSPFVPPSALPSSPPTLLPSSSCHPCHDVIDLTGADSDDPAGGTGPSGMADSPMRNQSPPPSPVGDLGSQAMVGTSLDRIRTWAETSLRLSHAGRHTEQVHQDRSLPDVMRQAGHPVYVSSFFSPLVFYIIHFRQFLPSIWRRYIDILWRVTRSTTTTDTSDFWPFSGIQRQSRPQRRGPVTTNSVMQSSRFSPSVTLCWKRLVIRKFLSLYYLLSI